MDQQTKRMRKFNLTLWLLLSELLLNATALHAANWLAPSFVTNDIPYWNDGDRDAVVDKSGNSIVLWVAKKTEWGAGQLWAKSRNNAGVWGQSTLLDSATDNSKARIKVSADGYATAVWINSAGIWTADRPVGQAWGAKKLLAPKPLGGFETLKFSMNSQGLAILTWSERSSAYYFNVDKIKFIRRPINTAWGAPGLLAEIPPYTFPPNYIDYVYLLDTLVGENGDILTAWGKYTERFRRYSSPHPNLQVSRLAKTSSAWEHSPQLGVLYTGFYGVQTNQVIHLLLDNQGRAGVIFIPWDSTNTGLSWSIAKQIKAGQAWSQTSAIPMPNDYPCDSSSIGILPDGTPGYCMSVISPFDFIARNDGLGNISILYTNTYQHRDINMQTKFITTLSKMVSGNLGSSAWTAPSLVSKTEHKYGVGIPDNFGVPVFDLSNDGSAFLAWGSDDPVTKLPVINSKKRSASNASWVQDSSFVLNLLGTMPLVMAVNANASGNAAVLTNVYDPSTNASALYLTSSTYPLPDLVVTALTYDKATGKFTCTIKNQGLGATPAGVWIGVGYYIDGVNKTWGTVKGPLAPGASATINTNGVAAFVPSGMHTISAYVDDSKRVAETNEANNKLTQSVTIP